MYRHKMYNLDMYLYFNYYYILLYILLLYIIIIYYYYIYMQNFQKRYENVTLFITNIFVTCEHKEKSIYVSNKFAKSVRIRKKILSSITFSMMEILILFPFCRSFVHKLKNYNIYIS